MRLHDFEDHDRFDERPSRRGALPHEAEEQPSHRRKRSEGEDDQRAPRLTRLDANTDPQASRLDDGAEPPYRYRDGLFDDEDDRPSRLGGEFGDEDGPRSPRRGPSRDEDGPRSPRRGQFEDDDGPQPARRRARLGDETDQRFSRRARFDDEPEPTRSGRLTEGERVRLAKLRDDAYTENLLPDGADRWSTWDDAEHGPLPRPDWVVTELAAVDTDLGVLKTGKEADVHLLRRGLPGTPGGLLAAKRYRSDEHKLFHRDAGYLEGRRMRRSRETRAMTQRSAFGRNLIAEQWAVAEFAALGRLWTIGAPVPYPVQRNGTELLLEFLGEDDGTAAPRLAQVRPEPDELADLWFQATAALELLAAEGLAHGDLSAYNLLVHRGRLVVIDLPQVVDVVANPGGVDFLARDVRNLAGWFHARGLGEHVTRPDELLAELVSATGIG